MPDSPDASKVCAVLGASGGMGAETVRALTAQGVRVLAVVRTGRGLDELGRQVGDSNRVAGCVLDLGALRDGAVVVEAALAAFGRLDGLVNTAAVYTPSPATGLTVEQWDAVMGPNLRGALLVTSAVGHHLVDRGGGRIVQVSSITAHVSRGDYTLYEASKAGLAAATRSMAVELAPHGVTVNAVAPGWVRTSMSRELLVDVSPEAVSALIPVGRVGEPQELAEVITWLMTRSPTFLTGQTIVVDGGQTAFTAHL